MNQFINYQEFKVYTPPGKKDAVHKSQEDTDMDEQLLGVCSELTEDDEDREDEMEEDDDLDEVLSGMTIYCFVVCINL